MHNRTTIVATKKIKRNMSDRRRLAREVTNVHSNDSESSLYILHDQAFMSQQTKKKEGKREADDEIEAA